VRVVAASSEREAAETFHRAELQSPRFREDVLAGRRGWRVGDGLFDGLPTDLEWQRLALTPDEVLDIRYIHWHWWQKISGATRSPREAARRIRAGLVPGADPEWHRPIAERLRSDDPPPELIVIAKPRGPLVLLEGHIRLTAYALWPEYLPDELEILLGVSENAPRWGCY
jgi:hypothetical protein